MNADIKDSDKESSSDETTQSSAGNFLRNDQSLVMRSVRSDRFTDKFKEGIVQRILQGTTSINDIREQHYLTEQDVIAWMKQSFDRKQKRIDDLMHQLRESEASGQDRIIKIESQPRRINIQGDVIDGRSHTK